MTFARDRSRVAVVVPLVGLCAATLVATGCGAGRYNQNFKTKITSDAAQADVGPVLLRDVTLSAPAEPGGDAVLSFAMYAARPQDSDVLSSITAPELSDQPLTLLGPGGTDVASVAVAFAARPAAHRFSATIRSPKTQLLPATYHSVLFTFAAGGQTSLKVPVRKLGQVAPGASAAPGALPDSPFPTAP